MSARKVAIFQGKQIRRRWDGERELWYFSVVDVIAVLTDSSIPRRYWSDLKIKLQKEGSEVYEKIVQLKMVAVDGKYYLTDAADPELAINRALKTYLQKGYSKEWINQRLKSIEIRKALTDEWETRGVKEGLEFAILTNEITEREIGYL